MHLQRLHLQNCISNQSLTAMVTVNCFCIDNDCITLNIEIQHSYCRNKNSFGPIWGWEHYKSSYFIQSELGITCWLCDFHWLIVLLSVVLNVLFVTSASCQISFLVWSRHCVSPVTHLWFIADLRPTALLWVCAGLQYTVCVSVCVRAEGGLVAGRRRGVVGACTQEGGPFVGGLWRPSSRPRLVLLSDPRENILSNIV